MGIPELMIVGVIAVMGVLPLAVGVWVLVTLFTMRKSQDEMRARLERLEQTLARR
jgi:cadmium resistance protein CadD (predicted permease)